MTDMFLSEEEMKILKSSFLFNNIDEKEICEVTADERCCVCEFNKGDIIYDVNNYKKELGIVLSGSIEVSKVSDSGSQFLMNELGAQSIFGVASVFCDEPGYVTTLTASSLCRIIFFPKELLRNVMENNFHIAENYISFLSGRIRFLNDKIDSIVFLDTNNALSKWIYENMKEEGDKRYVEPGVSYSRLAELLNMGRASLYRALDELERDGAIKREGKTIIVSDPEKLLNH